MAHKKRKTVIILALFLVLNIISYRALAKENNTGNQTEEIVTTEDNKAEIETEAEAVLAEAGNISHVGDTFADGFIDLLNEQGIDATIEKSADGTIVLTIGEGQGEILALLSQQSQSEASNYQNWNIKFTITGVLNLPDSFAGLGDDGYPFQGIFSNQSITVKTANTLFKSLSAKAELNDVKIDWMGEPDVPILANKLVADDAAGSVNISLIKAECFSPYIGQLTGGSGLVSLSILDYSAVEERPIEKIQGNAGLVCCEMDAGTKLQVANINMPGSVSLSISGSENVGGLIGRMNEGAELKISQSLTLDALLLGKNAGGLIGSANAATISCAPGTEIRISADITAEESGGGIVGVATTDTGILGSSANVIVMNADVNGNKNAGVLYGTCTVNGEFNSFEGVSFASDAIRKVSGTGNCGGLFGMLTLDAAGKCIIGSASESTTNISSSLTDAGNATAYGGVSGQLTCSSKANALIVDNCNIVLSIDVGTETAKYPKYIGGVTTNLTKGTVDAKHSTIDVRNPKTASEKNYGFGGIASRAGDDTLIIADTIAVKTNSFDLNKGGGGIAGSVGRGSVVYLKNSIDLSECLLLTNAYTGQIVGLQDCSLVYAPGADIYRLYTSVGGTSYSGMEIDDISNYGEMYRVPGLINVSDTYEVTFAKTLSKTGDVYALSDSLDYARFALAWQSRGYFASVDGVNKDNWNSLKTCNISLGDNIVMTGCGIGGLTRDVKSADDIFEGTFNGNGYKLTLDIGGANQANAASKGDGRIYFHNSTGLFASLSSKAKVNDITIAGSIRLSNNQYTNPDSSDQTTGMKSGGFAALLSCDTESTEIISNIKTEVVYDIKINGGKELYVGNVFGLVTGNKQIGLTLSSDMSFASNIKAEYDSNGSFNHIGGVIGAITKEVNIDIICEGATISGNMSLLNAQGKSYNSIYAGGLVGTIFNRSNNAERNIAINNLKYNNFSMVGNSTERMGGILGGVWADTNVTIDGLTTSNTSLTLNNIAELGGLVFRASGKWIVSSINLGGLTINAGKAKALGILICKGGPYRESLNSATGTRNNNGLYFEFTEHWSWNEATNKGYNVPTITEFTGDVFDEFIAYTAYGETGKTEFANEITKNGNGIISLKTDNGTVNMSEAERNTYENRTAIGQSKKTNLFSRYYYNLKSIEQNCNGGAVDTANELLIWSVYRYAAGNIQTFVTSNTDIKTNAVGGTSKAAAVNFDMDGLSYYPISIANTNITLRYANITFYNDEIETKEEGNKLTRGTDASHSQHYTMHCGLFLDYTATSAGNKYTMTVNGVSFAGTVGTVNNGSGALVCGTMKGSVSGGNASSCTVILASSDDEDNAVLLDGIKVLPVGTYTPVLINKTGSYAGIKANYIATTNNQTMLAGSSLIGDVGGQAATGVSLEFAGTIMLPEAANDVFSVATLANSIRYDNGLATYHFYKNKDYDDGNYIHNTTYGLELGENVSVEYAGKQGCYYDAFGAGYYVTANSNFDEHNSFDDCIPYVAFSPATLDSTHTLANGWHEIAVNVLSSDLTDGCGTYGHPYQIDANLLKEVANYINTGTASDGWQVCIAKDDVYHAASSDERDMILTYRSGGFVTEDNAAYSGDVQQYLANAYYVIKESIELTDFGGIGTDGTGQGVPFSGVISGKKNETITVTLNGGSSSFIKYSYGCVVRDITIVINQQPLLNREKPERASGLTQAETSPKTFFGGVIGCVLGGDNIIENVFVTAGSELSINPTGDKPHLVPIGGYIGVVTGGGVIFRGNSSDSTGITGADFALYRNSIIGRVLSGYAFYEGDGTVPDNGNKNYKINKITYSGQADISWTGSGLTINNAQGLLIASAIISSGAGSVKSVAYTKGRARNASYDNIGAQAEPSDYVISKKDGSAVWADGNTPYLLCKYAGYTGNSSICSSSTDGVLLEFAENGSFDMDGYDNGYRALSARYVSNAAFVVNSNGTSTVDIPGVVMRVSAFDGNNANVQNINIDVKEYNDDDFHAAALGGIFNIVWTKKQSGGTANSVFAKDLTLTSCNVKLLYIGSDGSDKPQADTATFADNDGLSGVTAGGFIGSVSDIDADDNTKKTIVHNYLLNNLHIDGGNITGPNSAGGLIGASAMTNQTVTGCPGKLLSNSKNAMFGPSFLNCSYNNVTVTAKLAAGGLEGYAFAYSYSGSLQFSGFGLPYSQNKCFTSCTVTEENLKVGYNSSIITESKRGVSGGLFGGCGMRVGVNDPNVNSNTGLSIAATSDMKKVIIDSVTILSSTKDEFVLQGNGSKNGPEGGTDYSVAAGIIGRIGNVNPTYFYKIMISGCTIKTGSRVNNEYAGGVVGYGYTNTSINIEQCDIISSEIRSKNAGGYIGYASSASGFNLNMSDCKLEECTVFGESKSGGLVGNASGKYYLFNLLIKNTSITGNSNKGRLFGYMNINASSNDFYIYAVGVSVYADPGRTNINIPDKDGNCASGRSYIGYIVYGDYGGMESKYTNEKSPYVTVNPRFLLNGANRLLTGDAVGKIEDDTYESVAARIWADNKTGATGKKNKATYPKAATIINAQGKVVPTVSNFYAEQGCGPSDLPVLTIPDANAGIIEDYLNVITNGGFSESGTTLSVDVYYYNADTNSFTKATADQLKKEPASIYLSSDAKSVRVRSNSFDNTRERFTLVEASFTVTVNGVKRTYNVSVPIIVERQLQYNFMSTFSYGAEFNADTFANLKNHVLESTGNPFTAYLTYQYNHKEQEYVEYDWQGYMDDGGDMMNVDKIISFSSGLPDGTQMILVDRQNGNMAYQYTTSGTNIISKTDVYLSRFTAVSDGTPFKASMAEILGVTSEPSDSGNYIVETDLSKATLRLKNEAGEYVYYRPLGSGEAATGQKYSLTVPDLEVNVPEENYYLVIVVPDQEGDFCINGSLSSSLNWVMPSKGTWVHRYNRLSQDVGSNDESSYQISTGYQQKLESTADIGAAINLSDKSQKMQVKVKDTITFYNQQAYSIKDQLFLKITTSLHEYIGGSSEVNEIQFPAGTTGTVHFYIQDENGRYYALNGSEWKTYDSKKEAAGYDWASRGADMELLLSTDGTTALDLAGVRQMIKGSQETGTSNIIVTAEMDIEFSGQDVLNNMVPASDQNGVDRWAQLNYVGRISTQEFSLSYSSAREAALDNAKYYRGVIYQAILNMDAASIDQLGVNPLQLVSAYIATVDGRKASTIDLTASLDLANLNDIEAVLKETESITFTLSLQRRQGNTYIDVPEATEYIDFDLSSYQSDGWTITIPQSEYYADGNIIKSNIFDGTQFTLEIPAYVFVNQKDYANYKIKLAASFTGNSSVINDDDAYVVYTFACINPVFYEPE